MPPTTSAGRMEYMFECFSCAEIKRNSPCYILSYKTLFYFLNYLYCNRAHLIYVLNFNFDNQFILYILYFAQTVLHNLGGAKKNLEVCPLSNSFLRPPLEQVHHVLFNRDKPRLDDDR
jgi:hypothetical protein